MKDVNSLPDLCLRKIFSLFPLYELLLIGQVCHRWKSLQKSVACMRTSMTLLFGGDARWYISNCNLNIAHLEKVYPNPKDTPFYSRLENCDLYWTQLQYECLCDRTTLQLSETFTNIDTLHISISQIPEYVHSSSEEQNPIESTNLMDHILILLNFWSSQLKTLKLWIHIEGQDDDSKFVQQFYRLFASLNRMVSLRCLSIVTRISFSLSPENVSLYLPVIEQLEEFCFDSYDLIQQLVPSLKKFGENNDRLKQISLPNVYSSDFHENFFQIPENEQIAKKITRLPDIVFDFSYPESDAQKMLNLCNRFSSLQTLSISCHSLVSIHNMIQRLQPLEQLIHLCIKVLFPNEGKDEVLQFERQNILDSINSNQVPELSSVKLLTINAFLLSHTELYPINWPVMFPNLAVLHYTGQFFCLLCEAQNDEEWKLKCLKLALKPWKFCSKLKAIYGHDECDGRELLVMTDFEEL